MHQRQRLILLVFTFALSTNCFAQDDKQEVLNVVNDFFHTMEAKDSTAFNNLFLENAYAYSVRPQGDSTVVRHSILKANDSKNILKERLREKEIIIHVNKNVISWLGIFGSIAVLRRNENYFLQSSLYTE